MKLWYIILALIIFIFVVMLFTVVRQYIIVTGACGSGYLFHGRQEVESTDACSP
jgi:hypothetical protein